MIKYVYFDTWFTWDFMSIVLFYLFSVYFYYVAKRADKFKSEDLGGLKKIKNPFWFGLAIALGNFFFTGLYCVITVGLYLFTVGLWNWLEKRKK